MDSLRNSEKRQGWGKVEMSMADGVVRDHGILVTWGGGFLFSPQGL